MLRTAPNPRRLLAAEDNPTNQIVLSHMLKALGYAFDMVDDGLAALEAFEASATAHPYAAILMDCNMPRLDGYDAVRLIRERERDLEMTRTPILAVTAVVTSEDRERARTAGMDAVVTKPLEVHVLRAALAKALQATDETGTTAGRTTTEKPADLLEKRAEELRAMGGEDMLREIYATFIGDARTALLKLDDALERADTSGLGMAAHSLKGISLNVGAATLADAARRLEQLGRGGRMEGADSLVTAIRNELTTLERDLPAA